jgi:lysophospholipase L1-like esterase
MKMISKIRKIITVVLVNCLVLIMLLALLELTGFLMVGRPAHGFLHTSWRLNHTYLKGTYINREYIRYHPEFTQPFTCVYNLQGWRENYDIARQKPKGTYRIFYVGDSFTEGTCAAEQSVPDIIKMRLNQDNKDKNLRIEVINTGTCSYSPILYYINIRHVICNFRPDMIVVAVDMTDDYDDWKYKHTALFDKEGNPWAVNPSDYSLFPFVDVGQGAVRATLLRKTQYFLYRNSSFYNMMRNVIKSNMKVPPNRFERGGPDSDITTMGKSNKGVFYKYWQWCQDPWDSLTAAQAQATLDYIRRICEFCHEKNIKLMLTSVPHYWQYNGDAQGGGKPTFSARPHKEIASVAERCGVPYHNAFEDLKSLITNTPETQYYNSGDIHFNPRGYRIWADAQYKFLSDSSNHLLPESFFNRGIKH